MIVFFNDFQCGCQNISIDLSVLRNRCKTQTTLVEHISYINNTYLTSETIAKCEPSNKLSKHVAYHNANKLDSTRFNKVRIFKNLEDYFQLNMLKHIVDLKLNDDTFIDCLSIKRSVTNMFDKICNYIPLFLYYTIDTVTMNIYIYIYEVLSDYHFKFCGDIINFVCSPMSRCKEQYECGTI